jgi:hypothetical protein
MEPLVFVHIRLGFPTIDAHRQVATMPPLPTSAHQGPKSCHLSLTRCNQLGQIMRLMTQLFNQLKKKKKKKNSQLSFLGGVKNTRSTYGVRPIPRERDVHGYFFFFFFGIFCFLNTIMARIMPQTPYFYTFTLMLFDIIFKIISNL